MSQLIILMYKATEWLENYLVNYQGALLVVSHDRYFLDRVVEKIWEVERGKLGCYRGELYPLPKREKRGNYQAGKKVLAAAKRNKTARGIYQKKYCWTKDKIRFIKSFVPNFLDNFRKLS